MTLQDILPHPTAAAKFAKIESVCFEFEIWNFEFICYLMLGICDFHKKMHIYKISITIPEGGKKHAQIPHA